MLLQETLRVHDKERFEFHYIYFLPWKNQLVSGLEENGGKVINLEAKNNIALLRQAGKIIHYIKEQEIDIVHCHLPWAGFVGRRIFKKIKLPVIYTEHNKQERYHFITRFINKISFNYQATVVAVSTDVEESIRKNIKPAIPVKVILNGVNAADFKRDLDAGRTIRKENGIADDTVLLGIIAVFRFQKRLKEWVDVFKSVLGAHPSTSAVIIGDGPLKDEIKGHIAAAGLTDRIIMPGLQTNVKPWLSAIDIFYMVSEFEGLPIALLEAMSMECAVVSTDAGGIKEVIRNDVDGFTVPVNEWQKIPGVISSLIANREQIKDWGNKARQRVETAFSLRTMVTATENLYQELLSDRKPGK